jgi:hypothetical protein
MSSSRLTNTSALARTRRPRLRALLSLCACASLLLGAAFFAGCKGGDDKGARIGGGGDKLKQAALPTLQVRLPASPSFKKDHAPALYPDNTLSVYGVRKKIKDLINKTVRVKGFVLDVYECPKCPKGATCKTCDAPHYYLSDRKDGPKEKALLVSDYPEKDMKTNKKIVITKGERTIVTGLFAKRSGTGFSSADGVLVFREHAPADVIK